MSKRKPAAGGYLESSDGPEEEPVQMPSDNPTKKPKTIPYAPPRLGTAFRPAPVPFQLSRSASAPARGLVTPTSSSAHLKPERSLRAASILQSWPVSGGNSVVSNLEPKAVVLHAPNAAVEADGVAQINVSKTSNEDLSSSTNKFIARSSLSLERQMNELTTTFEDYKTLSDEQHRHTDEKLTRLLEVVGRLVPAEDQLSDYAPSRSVSIGPNHVDTRLYLSNPSPTSELVSIVSKVVNEARSRVGKKKGGMDDNSLKEHARTTFYRMLGITAAKSIRPYFEDEHGEPDTLPGQFIDPDTNYCQPYPHWKASLIKQLAWIPTYILRFRSTIPNDRSDLSNMLRGLSDEQIVILLHDGPFKSAQTAWRDMRKTDTELETMRAEARRYRRTDKAGATTRSAYIKTISSLQSPDWEYLFQPGYMSQDESDGEGRVITKRPAHRAQWENNLFEAIRVAELEKAKGKSDLCPRPPRRQVTYVKRPIPHLERGMGSSKVTIRVAMCGLSKSWRERNTDELKKYGHLLNMRMTTKPDISAFLAKHPMPDNHSDHEGDMDGACHNGGDKDNDFRQLGDVGVQELGGECEGTDTEEGAVNVHGYSARDEEYSQADGTQSGTFTISEDYNRRIIAGAYGGVSPLGASGTEDNGDFPIDPELLDNEAGNDVSQLGDNAQQTPETCAIRTVTTSSDASASEPRQPRTNNLEPPAPVPHETGLLPAPTHNNLVSTTSSAPLLPPPPLHLEANPVANKIVPDNLPRGKRGRPPKKAQGEGAIPAQMGSAEGCSSVAQASVPPAKRRGRPPGSKNKKKVQE